MIPNVRKTWAPIGDTPILRHHQLRDRISVIGGISVSPLRKRLGLFVRLYSKNITGVEVIAFVRILLRHLRGPVVILWDGSPTHRRKIVRNYLNLRKRLHVHRFPAYAPELNPAELVWNHAKKTLSNGAPEDLACLRTRLRCALRGIRASSQRLRSCISATALPWKW